jgi:hypothetical protein
MHERHPQELTGCSINRATPAPRHSSGMRPRIALAMLVATVLCLFITAYPFQTETRLVALAGLVMYTAMLVAERRRSPRPN